MSPATGSDRTHHKQITIQLHPAIHLYLTPQDNCHNNYSPQTSSTSSSASPPPSNPPPLSRMPLSRKVKYAQLSMKLVALGGGALNGYSGCGLPVVEKAPGLPHVLRNVVSSEQGHAASKTPSLQRIVFVSVEFNGDHKCVRKLRQMRPPSVLGILPDFKQWWLSVRDMATNS